MASLTAPSATHLRTRSTADLVRTIVEYPELVHVIQALEAPVLGRLVEHVGLEDAAEIVALATTEQLERVFDEDLWQSERPGKDESFDALRFGLWLEILLEGGEELAIEKIASMDEDFLALGFSKLVLVIDIDALGVEMSESESDDRDLVEKALESCLYEEIEEFRIIARDSTRWDAVLHVLVGLDRDHHALLRRLLERCAAVTSGYVDDNGGLYDVLTSEEMLESDVAAEREDRREREGFVAPSAAASFLRLARSTSLDEILTSGAVDPVTKAHFRAAPRGALRPNRRPTIQARPTLAEPQPPTPPKVEAFLRELGAAGVLGEPRAERPLLPAKRSKRSKDGATDDGIIERAMRALGTQAPEVFDVEVEQLAYLVNVLMAVSRGAEQPLRAVEATEVVKSVCKLGLARIVELSAAKGAETDAVLARVISEHGLVKAFRVGWHLVGDEKWTAAGLQQVAGRARTGGPSRKLRSGRS